VHKGSFGALECARADFELWRCTTAHLEHWRRLEEAQGVWKSGGGAHQSV
jgi:hypothetical protein